MIVERDGTTERVQILGFLHLLSYGRTGGFVLFCHISATDAAAFYTTQIRCIVCLKRFLLLMHFFSGCPEKKNHAVTGLRSGVCGGIAARPEMLQQQPVRFPRAGR